MTEAKPPVVRSVSLVRLLPAGVLVGAVVLGLSIAAVTGDLLLGLLVLVLGLGTSAALQQLRQSRSVHRRIERLRRESRAASRDALAAARADGAVRSAEVAEMAATLRRSQRQRAERDAAVSAELARLSGEVRALTGVVDAQTARVLPLLERLSVHIGAAPRAVPASAPFNQPFSAVSGGQLLTGLQLSGSEPRVNLVLNSFTTSQAFAGVTTAVSTAVRAATRLGHPLRVILLRDPGESLERTAQTLGQLIESAGFAEGLAADLEISVPASPVTGGFHTEDVWIATYWTTAVAIQRAVDDGVARPDRVLYLVQDWEPGFMPWGAQHVLAVNTYSAGFQMVVNSSPLAEFIRDQTGIELPEQAVFGPQVDVGPIHEAAHRWTPVEPDRPRVLYYARPSKPRNLFSLGVDALRLWAAQLPAGVRPVVTFAGEDLPPLDIGDRMDVSMVGKTDLVEYYDLVANTDIGLALMYSPHPSHLALELPMAGIPTVTNEFHDARRPWVEGLTVAPPTPSAVATALNGAWQRSARLQLHSPRPLPALGGSLGDAVDFVLSGLRNQA